ncbi:MAG: DUF177 domain-containing protein [Gemmatimonadaceae bacterium]|nr:DUF177 domain-containing protein [Gemmatimonadaceae bacterium]MDQ3119191.1 DUF177 domain-containing protein [Verrucomicrobiota bacterium]
MLSFDIRSLESHAAHVDGRLAPDDPVWEDADTLPVGPVEVEGRLSAAGLSRFYFSGRFKGETTMPCRRCLTDVTAHVAEEAHFIFSSEGEDSSDDPDVYPFDPNAHSLDLRPSVREVWLLAVPGFVQCREDCKGLCPNCGTDLNTDTCDCTPVASDNRWDALRAIRDELP